MGQPGADKLPESRGQGQSGPNLTALALTCPLVSSNMVQRVVGSLLFVTLNFPVVWDKSCDCGT